MDTQGDSATSERLFSGPYTFPGMRLGQTMILYWTGSVALHQQMCLLYQELQRLAAEAESRPSLDDDPVCLCDEDAGEADPTRRIKMCVGHFALDRLPRLEHRTEWATTTARDVCRSAEYFLQTEMRSLGPAAIVPALLLVSWLLEREAGEFQREVIWIKSLLVRMQKKGNEIASCNNEEPEAARWKITA